MSQFLNNTVHIHWLTVTIFGMDVARDISAFGVERKRGGFGCKRSFQLADGAVLYANLDDECPAVLVLDGTFCEANQELLPKYASLGRVSRIDVASDECPYSPRDLSMFSERGLLVTRMRNRSFHSNEEGDTFNLGSRQSDRYLRCYDRRGVNRIEVECKGKMAHFLGQFLAQDSGFSWMDVISGCLRVVEDDGRRCDLSTVAPAWEAFLDGAGALRVSERDESSLDRVKQWVKHSVASTLATLRSVLDERDYRALLVADVDDVKAARWRQEPAIAPAAEPVQLAGERTGWLWNVSY